MTTIPLLSLAGYFLYLYQYIAMRHRVICAESDARIDGEFDSDWLIFSVLGDIDLFVEKATAKALYWNRGTK